LKRYL